MRISDLRHQVKQLIVKDRIREQPPRVDEQVMAPSELGYLYEPSLKAVQTYKSTVEPVIYEPESLNQPAELQHLIVPINVNSWCLAANGIQKLSVHTNSVLAMTNQLEKSVLEKKKIISTSKDILDEEDITMINSSIQDNTQSMVTIQKWINNIAQQLFDLINKRVNTQNELTNIKGGFCQELCEKLQRKTIKLKILQNVLSTRSECMQIPRF